MTTAWLGKPIGLGHTAQVYAWQDETILKLFYDWFPLRAIELEARIAGIVHRAGLPVPAVGEMVEIEGRYGLIYERVVGTSMLETLASRPWAFFGFARLLAELQAGMHKIEEVPDLPSQRQRLTTKIRNADLLSASLQDAALRLLDTLPDGDQLCHGDFHPDNVLITQKGPVIIDWIDATRGHPLGDVARSSLLMSTSPLPEGAPDTVARRVLDGMRTWFHRVYLGHYFRLFPGDRQTLAPWRIVNAAARLSEGIPEEKELLVLVQAALQNNDG